MNRLAHLSGYYSHLGFRVIKHKFEDDFGKITICSAFKILGFGSGTTETVGNEIQEKQRDFTISVIMNDNYPRFFLNENNVILTEQSANNGIYESINKNPTSHVQVVSFVDYEFHDKLKRNFENFKRELFKEDLSL